VETHGGLIDARIDYERDFLLDYFGFKTMEKSYLLKNSVSVVRERPQHLWMRVSLALWGSVDLKRAFETYDMMSLKRFTHATPTLFNAGTPRQQLSSCFLMGIGDSIQGIYKTLGDCAAISKHAGGIGMHISNIRAKGSIIRGTNGKSNGLVPMLRVFNNTARYVDQCFGADTLVYTSTGSNKICLIQPGNYVLSSGGHYVRVNKQLKHSYSGPILNITIEGSQGPVVVTPEHPILSVHALGATKFQDVHERLARKLTKIDYNDAGTLQVGDYVAFPASTNIDKADYYNGFYMRRIKAISHGEFSGVLYDFEVDSPHDYTVVGLGVAHNGGGKRNGSFAVYLEPWHADVEDFLRLKLNGGAEEERARDLFYALWMPDLFMRRVEEGGLWTLFCPDEAPGLADVYGEEFDTLYTRYEAEGRGKKTVEAQKLWFQILDTQIETGTPYLLYKDAANIKSNQKNLGVIKSSNLCVAPETMILTDKGMFPIVELEGKEVNVWNGEQWSGTTVVKTGEDQRLISVNLSNGAVLECTPYHKFLLSEGYSSTKTIKNTTRIEASELKEGMKLMKFDLPVLEGDKSQDIPYPYTHGFFCGDGTVHKAYNGGPGSKGLALYGEKKNLIDKLEIRSSSFKEDAQGRINTVLPHELPDKYYVPMNSSIECRLQWFAGMLDSDGTVANNGTNQSLQISSIHFGFLNDIRLMLQTLGVQAKITKSHDANVRLLPDGKGGHKEYDCKTIWRLLVSSSGLYQLMDLGLQTHRLQIEKREPQRNAEQFVYVVSVADVGRTSDTYCFNEPINHAGIFNGILTGNCTEIMEYTSETEVAVCNLASMALPSYVDSKTKTFNYDEFRQAVAVAVRNLNRVIDINYYPIPETRTSNMRHRPVGLGVQGLADVFALMDLPWESPAAADLNQRIFEHMYYAAVEASHAEALATQSYSSFPGSPASQGLLQPDLWGITPLTEQDKTLDWPALRAKASTALANSLLIAPMPTASTSQILGYNECIEPFTSNIYTRRTLAGEFIIVNRHLVADLTAAGLWSEEMKQLIIACNGSIQQLDVIPAALKEKYKTSWELKQKTLIDMAAARGAFVCQSQSLNLFVSDPTYSKLTSMHFYAWKRGLKTGLYYLRTKAGVQAQKFTVDPKLLASIQAKATQAEPKPVELKKETRKEMLDRLAREYEEEQAKECTMCSA
jgi:ribonucleoside-diphosphate reductase alpha chain